MRPNTRMKCIVKYNGSVSCFNLVSIIDTSLGMKFGHYICSECGYDYGKKVDSDYCCICEGAKLSYVDNFYAESWLNFRFIGLRKEKNMSRNSSSGSSSGLGLCSVLTIVFIVLKLVGVIDWSWLWVLSPLWIEIILVIVLLIIIALLDRKSRNKWNRSDRLKW